MQALRSLIYGGENSQLKIDILKRVNSEGSLQDMVEEFRRPGHPPDP